MHLIKVKRGNIEFCFVLLICILIVTVLMWAFEHKENNDYLNNTTSTTTSTTSTTTYITALTTQKQSNEDLQTTRKTTTTTRFEILPTETKNPAMPNSYLTPGEVMETNLSVICEKGYASSVRYVRACDKEYTYAVYGIRTRKPNDYQLEHLIPLCLGGSNGVKNLWPAPYLSARMKARLDTRICNLVCKGEIDLLYAQTHIRADWYKLYLEMNLSNN